MVGRRVFGGLAIEEIGNVLVASPATVKRKWNLAAARLSRQMKEGSHGQAPAMAEG
jgi:DNA-directed RNA polymerase specialized sigma24 family protein